MGKGKKAQNVRPGRPNHSTLIANAKAQRRRGGQAGEEDDDTKKSEKTGAKGKGKGKAPASHSPSPSAPSMPLVGAPLGLRNLGNTCFFNSVLQVLSQVRPLRAHYAQRPSSLPAPLERDLAKALRATFALLCNASNANANGNGKGKGNGAVSPSELFTAVKSRYSSFRGNGQQDAEELYRRLLEALIEDARKVTEHARPLLAKPEGTMDAAQRARLTQHAKELEMRSGAASVEEATFAMATEVRVTCAHCGTVTRTKESDVLDLQLALPQRCQPRLVLTQGRGRGNSRGNGNGAVTTQRSQGAKKKQQRMGKRDRMLAARRRQEDNGEDKVEDIERQEEKEDKEENMKKVEEEVKVEEETKEEVKEKQEEKEDKEENKEDMKDMKVEKEGKVEEDTKEEVKENDNQEAKEKVKEETVTAKDENDQGNAEANNKEATSIELKNTNESTLEDTALKGNEDKEEEEAKDPKDKDPAKDTDPKDEDTKSEEAPVPAPLPLPSPLVVRVKEFLATQRRDTLAHVLQSDARSKTLESESANENASANVCSVAECLALTTAPETLEDYACYACTRNALAQDAEVLTELIRQYAHEERRHQHDLRLAQGEHVEEEVKEDIKDMVKEAKEMKEKEEALTETSLEGADSKPSSSPFPSHAPKQSPVPSPSLPLLRGSALRQTLVAHSGPIVALHLKRFSYGQKLNTSLDYPLELTLDAYTEAPSEFDSEKRSSNGIGRYRLLGVSCHDGSLNGGHYTAIVRAKGLWYRISDTNVQRCDERAALNAHSSAYLIFYERQEEEEKVDVMMTDETASNPVAPFSSSTSSAPVRFDSDVNSDDEGHVDDEDEDEEEGEDKNDNGNDKQEEDQEDAENAPPM